MAARKRSTSPSPAEVPAPSATPLRIVGGRFRGRKIAYSGDPVTRPMKDNIREAIFNLVGAWIPGRAAIDLFAGTGAVGIEALSRGASRALFIERHFPTARLLQANLRTLEDNLPAEVFTSDTFFWVRQFLKHDGARPVQPWAVFCCPPYGLYSSRGDDLMSMIEHLMAAAPAESVLVVESDGHFDPARLPQADRWRVRQYRPAQIAVFR